MTFLDREHMSVRFMFSAKLQISTLAGRGYLISCLYNLKEMCSKQNGNTLDCLRSETEWGHIKYYICELQRAKWRL